MIGLAGDLMPEMALKVNLQINFFWACVGAELQKLASIFIFKVFLACLQCQIRRQPFFFMQGKLLI